MTSVLRMLDANFNRAREALRVMEDVARFHLGNEGLCTRIKTLRHGLAAVSKGVSDAGVGGGAGGGAMLASRDTPGDVGTGIKTAAEGERATLREVATAACKRLTEALRVIEECMKVPEVTAAEGLARRVELMRYEAYDVEKVLLLALAGGRGRQWGLCVLITEALCKRPWLEVAAAAMAGGADCLQLREKELESAELLRRARALVEVARPQGVAVTVNDRADIALLAGADGVHVGQGDLSVHDVRRLAGAGLLVGVSTHDLGEARAAVEAGADYCGIGAMFATSTKARETSGVGYLRAYLAEAGLARVPHLAIGGVTPGNVGQLRAAGCRGIAVSAAVCGADDPAVVARALAAS